MSTNALVRSGWVAANCNAGQAAGAPAEHDRPFAAELVEHDDHVVDAALNQAALHRCDRI
jgi:hypothetical protein